MRSAENKLLTVADVRRHTGLTRKALLVYESLGLVRPAARTEAGYRLYDDHALRRLFLVTRARGLGLTLAEAEDFLDAAEACCGERQRELATIVARKLAETQRHLEQLSTRRQALRRVLTELHATNGDGGVETVKRDQTAEIAGY